MPIPCAKHVPIFSQREPQSRTLANETFEKLRPIF